MLFVIFSCLFFLVIDVSCFLAGLTSRLRLVRSLCLRLIETTTSMLFLGMGNHIYANIGEKHVLIPFFVACIDIFFFDPPKDISMQLFSNLNIDDFQQPLSFHAFSKRMLLFYLV